MIHNTPHSLYRQFVFPKYLLCSAETTNFIFGWTVTLSIIQHPIYHSHVPLLHYWSHWQSEKTDNLHFFSADSIIITAAAVLASSVCDCNCSRLFLVAVPHPPPLFFSHLSFPAHFLSFALWQIQHMQPGSFSDAVCVCERKSWRAW